MIKVVISKFGTFNKYSKARCQAIDGQQCGSCAVLAFNSAPLPTIHWQKVAYLALLFFIFCGTATPTATYALEGIRIEGNLLVTPPVVIGGMQDFPPYEFLDENDEPTGFNVELTNAIANVMEMNVEIKLGRWAQIRKELQDGTIDALQGMNYSEERTKEVDFSPPHSIVQYSIWGRWGAPKIGSLIELEGKEVIVLESSISHDLLRDAGLKQDLIITQSYGAALRLLASGKHDYLVAAKLPIQGLVNKLRLRNLVPIKNINSLPYGFVVKRGNLELLGRFSEGLAILKKTGEYQEIHHRWLGVFEPQGVVWAKIVTYGAPVIFLLILGLSGTVVWSRTLKRQVEHRTAALAFEVAERERAMEELRLHQQQLIQADKMASLGILVAGVGHEINNPIGGILLGLPTLLKAHEVAQVSLDSRYQEQGDFMIGGLKYSVMREEIPYLFTEMMDGAKRIKRIVEDLKDFSRTIDPTLTNPLDFNDVVKTSVRLAEHTIKKSTDNFTATYAEELPKIKGSAQRLEQVIINLILNACQALQGSEQSLSVTTLFDVDKREVLLEVKDEGSGIAFEHLSHLTDPFFTTKREVGGTGLGLSISAGIVKEHGGELRFNSTPGTATVVTLALPVAMEDNTE